MSGRRVRSGGNSAGVVAAQVLVERALDVPDCLGQVRYVRPDLRDVATHLSELGVHLTPQATDLSPHLASQATELGPHLASQPTNLPAQQGQGCDAASDNDTDQSPNGDNHHPSLATKGRPARRSHKAKKHEIAPRGCFCIDEFTGTARTERATTPLSTGGSHLPAVTSR